MTRVFSFAATLALPLLLAAGTTGAKAAPAEHCTFTSPASFTCPAEVTPPVQTTASRVVADHCVALTPASTACPAAPVAVASRAPVRISRN